MKINYLANSNVDPDFNFAGELLNSIYPLMKIYASCDHKVQNSSTIEVVEKATNRHQGSQCIPG